MVRPTVLFHSQNLLVPQEEEPHDQLCSSGDGWGFTKKDNGSSQIALCGHFRNSAPQGEMLHQHFIWAEDWGPLYCY